MQHLTTPFGRRPLTAAQIEAQAIADACPRDAAADKWSVLRNIAAARHRLGLADRSVAVLSALLSFHPETCLVPTGEAAMLIVFPSNRQLAARANGIAEATLRAHLGALVEAGLIVRRDSPNGKRYTRKGEGGAVAQAFGFDLTPLVARVEEFASLATQAAAEDREARLARERVSLARRDVRKLLEWATVSGASGPWDALASRLEAVCAALPRRPSRAMLTTADKALSALLADTHNALNNAAESRKSNGNAADSERHHQNSKPEPSGFEIAAEQVNEAGGSAFSPKVTSTYPLGMVLAACPDIADYVRGGVRTWSDLVAAADLVRSMLGISPSAWIEAKAVMGPDTAAVTVAAILQRSEHIRSPGGYLRTLVGRKKDGRFSLGPVLQALLRHRLAGEEGGSTRTMTVNQDALSAPITVRPGKA